MAIELMGNQEEEAPLVVADASESETPKNPTRDVHILSCSFLLVFLAYGAAQNLETTVNARGNLGTVTLGILYVSFAVFSLFASLVVRVMGSKNALVLGTTGYWLFIAANLKPTWYTMIPVSLFLGFAASIIWVGEGTYLTSLARNHASDSNLHEGTVIGNFNGEFWAMFALHQFVGNLITLAVLESGADGSTSNKTFLFIVFLCSMTLDAFDHSPCCLFRITASFCMTYVCNFRAEYTKDVVNPTLGEAGVGGAMAVYGAFDAICSLVAGRLTSGLRSITIIVCVGAFFQAVIFIWLSLKYSATGGVLGIVYPLLMAALLGIGDGVLNTQLSALLALLFKHDMEGAFSQLKVWQSSAISAVFFLNPSVTLRTMAMFMLAAIFVSLAPFMYLILKVEKAFSKPNTEDPRRYIHL
ncbi:hypothetical protein V6N12_035824 [Hibiscus sabdariffa]|uniref:UNC93-like protein 3 n=1 Tax=Hibiscus sabdariffa TaxID=183260 RepID=A0ABR2ENW1_9ROSI